MKKYYELIVDEFGGELEAALKPGVGMNIYLHGETKQQILKALKDELDLVDFCEDGAEAVFAASYDADTGEIVVPYVGTFNMVVLEVAA